MLGQVANSVIGINQTTAPHTTTRPSQYAVAPKLENEALLIDCSLTSLEYDSDLGRYDAYCVGCLKWTCGMSASSKITDCVGGRAPQHYCTHGVDPFQSLPWNMEHGTWNMEHGTWIMEHVHMQSATGTLR